MKAGVVLLFCLILFGCKELSEIEQCKDDMIEANITIAGLQIKITKLKLNRTDVLEAQKETDEIEIELQIEKNKNNTLRTENTTLRFENDLLIEYIKSINGL